MTTSMNDTPNEPGNGNEPPLTPSQTGGAFADALTIVRVLLTPIIMFVIIKAWSAKPGDADGFISLDLKLVLLASVLFAIAAITDVLDDYVGGSALRNTRQFGWFDDIADSVLVAGTLLALVWVLGKANLLYLTFAVPVIVLIGRDILLGLFKGYEFSKFGFLETKLGDLKSVLAMLATCILVAAPWLSNILDNIRASHSEDVLQVYGNASSFVWNTGIVILWAAAILSLWTGWQLLTNKAKPRA